VSGTVVAETDSLRKDRGREVQPLEANVTVEGVDGAISVMTGWQHGEYHRPLAPGRYTLVVRSEGYSPSRSNVTVPADGSGVVRNFVLHPRRPARAAAAAGGSASAAAAKLMATMSEREPRGDNMFLVIGGLSLLLGLWQIHKRMLHLSGVSGRERSA
jgi:hypothetical protein